MSCRFEGHIEAVTFAGTRHLATVTLNVIAAELEEHLNALADAEGHRWLPPDVSDRTLRAASLLIGGGTEDDTSEEEATKWIADGGCFVIPPNRVTNPDIDGILVFTLDQLREAIPNIPDPTREIAGALALMEAHAGGPGTVAVRLIIWRS